jgi:hypothetical protein
MTENKNKWFLPLVLSLVFIGMSSEVSAANLGVSYNQLMVGMEDFFPDMKLITKYQPPYFEGVSPLDIRAVYLLGIEMGSDGGKIEPKGFYSAMLWVPLEPDLTDKKLLPFITMLHTCLRNAVPEWTNDDERNDWLTEALGSVIKGANLKYGALSNLKSVVRIVGHTRIAVWLMSGVISLEIDAR